MGQKKVPATIAFSTAWKCLRHFIFSIRYSRECYAYAESNFSNSTQFFPPLDTYSINTERVDICIQFSKVWFLYFHSSLQCNILWRLNDNRKLPKIATLTKTFHLLTEHWNIMLSLIKMLFSATKWKKNL